MTVESSARNLLEQLGHPRAQQLSAGELTDLANLIHAARAALTVLEKVEYVGGPGDDYCPERDCQAALYARVPHNPGCTLANAIRLLRQCR